MAEITGRIIKFKATFNCYAVFDDKEAEFLNVYKVKNDIRITAEIENMLEINHMVGAGKEILPEIEIINIEEVEDE